jgi:5-methylcytosine-specific restriction endonuclease McrA
VTFHQISLLTEKEPFKYYEEISKAKKKYKNILYGSKEEKSRLYRVIKRRYRQYSINTGRLEGISKYSSFDLTEKYALIHCYNGKTKKIKELKKAIIDKQSTYFQSKCTYCGVGGTEYMDHYLPKDDYPEYSVHSYNLIPCCSYCNEKKSESFLDKLGTRKVFNPYFDSIDKEPMLICHITLTNKTLSYSLESLVSENTVYSNHLTTLGLIERYETEIPRIITTTLGDMKDIYIQFNTDKSNIKQTLNKRLIRTEKEQGVNSLNAVICRAILANDFVLERQFIEEYLD